MFNGAGKIIKVSNIDVTLYTDSSGLGFGGFAEGIEDYFYGTWEDHSTHYCHHIEPSPTFDNVIVSISHRELN